MQGPAKIKLLTGGRDLRQSLGLEIGPREAPLIRREAGPILYADYVDTETLRAGLHASLDPAALMEVDVVTGGGKLSAVMPRPVDYIVASHVVEHVPDLLGWLADLREVLKPGGTLGLAIPDRRFTFDRFRQESTIAEAVEAYLLQYDRPSVRQIFDCAWHAVTMEVSEGWRGGPDPAAASAYRMGKLPAALELVRGVHESGRYNEAHCWVFTPASFLDLCGQAAALSLFAYELADFHPTESGGYEFYAVLRRMEPGGDAIGPIEKARKAMQGWPPEAEFAEAHLSDEVRTLRAENAALREGMAVMRESTSWRITAPVRRLAARFRG